MKDLSRRSLFTVLGAGLATVAAVGIAEAQPIPPREERRPGPGNPGPGNPGPGNPGPGHRPPEPPPREDSRPRRPSQFHVWVPGHWAWRGRWVWTRGHWGR